MLLETQPLSLCLCTREPGDTAPAAPASATRESSDGVSAAEPDHINLRCH